MNQMAAVSMRAIPTFRANSSVKNLFVCAKTYANYHLSKEYCIGRHQGKTCFLPNSRYHNKVTIDLIDSLQRIDAFCFIYMNTRATFPTISSEAKLLHWAEICLIMSGEQSFLTEEKKSI